MCDLEKSCVCEKDISNKRVILICKNVDVCFFGVRRRMKPPKRMYTYIHSINGELYLTCRIILCKSICFE